MLKSKRLLLILLIVLIVLSGCTTQTQQDNTQEEDTMNKQVVLTINDKEYDITLYDTQAAQALYEMLPLDLTFEDFNQIEKISYLEEELPTDNEPDGYQPKVGDLCLYAPWGNLSIFYKEFRYSNSLISLGHIETDISDLVDLSDGFKGRLEVK